MAVEKSRLDFFCFIPSSTASTYPHFGLKRRWDNALWIFIHRVIHLSTSSDAENFFDPLENLGVGTSKFPQKFLKFLPLGL